MDKEGDKVAKKQNGNVMKQRVILMTVITATLLTALGGRTAYLQFVRGQDLKQQALDQQTQEKEITPKRGTIYDRNGKELAVSANVETIVADPSAIREKGNTEDVVQTLSSILQMDQESIRIILNKNSRFEYVKKRVESDPASQIRKYISGTDESGNKLSEEEMNGHDLTGISMVEDTKRYYPYGSFACHVIGFTGADNQGLEGIESIYDKYLKGTSGKVVKAGNNRATAPFEYEKYYGAEDGNSLVLTIDETIQHFVEKNLEQACIDNKVKQGACAIVMQPQTGEILALANYPSYDLNNPRQLVDQTLQQQLEQLPDEEYNTRMAEELQKMWRNKAVVDTYEPGSTFKLITAAMALEEKVTTLQDTYSCPGYKEVGGVKIHCWQTAGHGTETFLQGLVNSCNPVLMSVGEKIGPEEFYRYYKLFGFRELSGFDMPGEAVGSFHTYENFNSTELATASFGQGFTITPLQMVTAVSSLVNGGVMYRPHIVKQIKDSEGNIVEDIQPEIIRQPISKETSEQMKFVMETVVNDSGSKAAVKGYRIGGKSGTSEKQPRGNNKYIGSFVAAAPIDDPQIVCLVILDEPEGESYYGGQTAAPAAGKIVEEIMQYYNIEPSYTEEELAAMMTTVPDVTGKTVDEAKNTLTNYRLGAKIVGTGTTITGQEPQAGTTLKEYSSVTVYTDGATTEANMVTVPDVIGKTATEVNKILTDSGLNAKVTGGGNNQTSIKQDPAAGTKVAAGTAVTVEFQAQEPQSG